MTVFKTLFPFDSSTTSHQKNTEERTLNTGLEQHLDNLLIIINHTVINKAEMSKRKTKKKKKVVGSKTLTLQTNQNNTPTRSSLFNVLIFS